MSELPTCPECSGTYAYPDGNLLICPECSHEWSAFQNEFNAQKEAEEANASAVRDAFGNVLAAGDQATMVKDVKINGSSNVIKQGTRVQDIKLEANGAHNIVAKVDGFGMMELKSELIKKA